MMTKRLSKRFLKFVSWVALLIALFVVSVFIAPEKIILRGDWQIIDQHEVIKIIEHFSSIQQRFYWLPDLREQLQDVPWVKDVTIKRGVDGQVRMNFSTITPIARLTSKRWLGAHGKIIHSAYHALYLQTLPIFDGDNQDLPLMISFYSQLKPLLHRLPWRLKQLSYYRVSKQWVLEFSNHSVLRLGQDDIALQHFHRWMGAIPILKKTTYFDSTSLF